MDLEQAIRTRRTHKAYGPDPVPREVLDELFELARWAPNHHMTNPWRFAVLGPEAIARLKAADEPESAGKLDRAPTLVAVTSRFCAEDPVQDQEDLMATACAAYIVLLAAHARGFATYWRTPKVLRTDAGKDALGVPRQDHAVGLLHLGLSRQEQRVPDRAPLQQVVSYLP